MLKRSIVISSPCNLYTRNQQLMIETSTGKMTSVPIEDLGIVIIENQQATISIPAMNSLIKANVCVTICDKKLMPSGMVFPLECNTLQGERYRMQIEATLPTKKSIWKQIIEAKIRNQSLLLDKLGYDGQILKPYYRNVKSGDSDNREGIAASIYWKKLFGKDFIRNRNGMPPNNLLNYGYSVLRAATTRAIVGAGMLPSLGIHHKNKYNAFPLSDDIMEPFRPWVDDIVFALINEEQYELTRDTKAALINLIYADTLVDKLRHPLSIALSMLCASVVDVMAGEKASLKLPRLM